MYRLPTLMLVLFLSIPMARAEISHDAVREALCKAAGQESALPGQMDSLIEGGVLRDQQGAEILSMQCGDRAMIELMVEGLQAENLEYMVVDMRVDPREPVLELGDGSVSVNDYLDRQSREGTSGVAEFASQYLDLLGDQSFNPSLIVLNSQ